jgi:predicted deacylase
LATRRQTTELRLPGSTTGTTRTLTIHRWRGRAGGPKAYLQASIHAEEIPALLAADRLAKRLDALARAGRIRGEVVLVPYANPIGLDQFVGGTQLGRFHLDSGRNFNRNYPNVLEAVSERLGNRLGRDAERNVRLIRNALRAVLDDPGPQDEHGALKWALFREAADSDIVLDLHCDFEALVHLYVPEARWPEARDLASAIGAAVTLISGNSGGDSFDESSSRIYWQLSERHPDLSIPAACLGATVELRGERDVSDELGARDADNLVAFLAGRGVVDAPVRRNASRPFATRLESVDVVMAPASGILVWHKALGARVVKNALLGEIVVPGTGAREPIRCRTAGLFFTRRGHRYVHAGQGVAKVAGKQPLAWRKPGALLYD